MSTPFDPRSALLIAASTNASPIQVTTQIAHGLATSDQVYINDHLVNTNANGQYPITVVDTLNFTLNGSTGNGVGVATGAVVPYTTGGIQLPSDGDGLNAASVDAGLAALADRIAFVKNLTVMSYQAVTANTSLTVPDGARLALVLGCGCGGPGNQGTGGAVAGGTTTNSYGGGGGGAAPLGVALVPVTPRSSIACTLGTPAGNLYSSFGSLATFMGGGEGAGAPSAGTTPLYVTGGLCGANSEPNPTTSKSEALLASLLPGSGGWGGSLSNDVFGQGTSGAPGAISILSATPYAGGVGGTVGGTSGGENGGGGGGGGGGGPFGPGGAGGHGGAGSSTTPGGGGTGTNAGANTGAGGGGGGGGGNGGASSGFGGGGGNGGSGQMIVVFLGAPQ